jgi:hypothetical protein
VPTIRSVSSVLSPVGPERPTVYWLRRGVIIVILLALVLLVAHACAGGSATTPAAGSHHATSSPSPQPSASPSATRPSRCTATDLSVSLATDSSTYSLGKEPTFTATFRNGSGTTCRLFLSVASRQWTVTSGTATTWTTTGCHLTGKPARALLTSTSTASVSISWDAHRNDSSCTVGAAALAGTYVLRGTFEGVTAKPAVFHLVS